MCSAPASHLSPTLLLSTPHAHTQAVMSFLNELFGIFDALCDLHGVHKVGQCTTSSQHPAVSALAQPRRSYAVRLVLWDVVRNNNAYLCTATLSVCLTAPQCLCASVLGRWRLLEVRLAGFTGTRRLRPQAG